MTIEDVISRYTISEEYPVSVRGLVLLEEKEGVILAIHPDDLRELDAQIASGEITLEETGLEKYYKKWREEGLL